jgi:hypothetical protein
MQAKKKLKSQDLGILGYREDMKSGFGNSRVRNLDFLWVCLVKMKKK